PDHRGRHVRRQQGARAGALVGPLDVGVQEGDARLGRARQAGHRRQGGAPGVRRRGGMAPRDGQAGFSLVGIAVGLVVLAVVRSSPYAHPGPPTKPREQVREEPPPPQARMAADRATVPSIRASLQMFYTQNGQWPPSKEAVAALLSPPPNFQCAGNDYTYDP